MRGWNFYHSSKGRGKGCCLFSRNKIQCSLIGQFSSEDFSLLSMKIYKDIQIYVIYLSQSNNDVKERLWEEIRKLKQKNLHVMIIGDFNIDARNLDLLTNHFIRHNLVQLVKEPTHIEGRIIDHLWVSQNLPKIDLNFHYPYYTQHKSLIIKFEE